MGGRIVSDLPTPYKSIDFMGSVSESIMVTFLLLKVVLCLASGDS